MTTAAQEQFTELAILQMHRKKTNVTKLAKKLGYARNTVSRTINHPSIHPTVRADIAKELKIKL